MANTADVSDAFSSRLKGTSPRRAMSRSFANHIMRSNEILPLSNADRLLFSGQRDTPAARGCRLQNEWFLFWLGRGERFIRRRGRRSIHFSSATVQQVIENKCADVASCAECSVLGSCDSRGPVRSRRSPSVLLVFSPQLQDSAKSLRK